MSDFTDRLRLWARDIQLHRSALGADADILKAADTIERQDAEIAALQARVAELEGDLAKARNPQWFYAEGSEEHCLSDPSDAIDFYDLAVGKHVVPVGCARPLPDIWCAVHVRTKEEREASEHHEPFVFTEHASEDEARAAISKEPTQ